MRTYELCGLNFLGNYAEFYNGPIIFMDVKIFVHALPTVYNDLALFIEWKAVLLIFHFYFFKKDVFLFEI